MRNKKDLAELIFDYFRRTNSRSGHIMQMRNVKFQVIEKLNPKEQKLIIESIKELIEHEYISYENGDTGIECLRLTDKGYNYIYDDNGFLECCLENSLAKEVTIKETQHWLDAYPEVKTIFDKALAKYEKHEYQRNVLDDMRLALETLLKKVLRNEKSLENQKDEIGKFLKSKGYSSEFTNMFIKLLDYFSKYQNNYIKHNDNVPEKEIDFTLHLTTLFMRNLL